MAFFSSITGIVKGIGRALAGTVSVLGGFLGDYLFWRIIGFPGFILDLVGVRFTKKLRIKFFILMDENGAQLVPKENLGEIFKITKNTLKDQADIELISTGVLIAGGAPEGALDVTTANKSFIELWGEVGTYFNTLAGFGPFTRRLSVIIVNTLEEDGGRSFGSAANFVLIEKRYFIDTKNPLPIIAHEIGHACGLLHRKPKVNLMYKNDNDEFVDVQLSTWQSSVMRNSRFVWYF